MQFTIMKLWLPILLSICMVSAKRNLRVSKRAAKSNFVSTSGGQFMVNGSAFRFVGTNAYWLHTLNADEDISNTFANISKAGIKVVRTWAFNDVHEIPVNGTWFQSIANGTVTVNNGTNGLPRLDKVVKLAEQHGLYLLLSLTNNWNPLPGIDGNSTTNLTRRDVTPGTDNTLNRNVLSNDYGGMDAYVRQFGVTKNHDEFYTNQTIIDLFKNYTTNVVSRYVNSPAVFGWELANDPRCNSTLGATNSCTPQTVTRWHSTLAQHVASVDPNHIIASGNQGFFCTDCPKLFPRPVTPPKPAPSHSSSDRRRKLPVQVTKKNLIKERAEKRKKARELAKRSGSLEQTGVKIRGRWASTPTRRQDNGLGSAYDGSLGVDSEDILGIPQIGFSSFQLFPDQNLYAPDDPSLSPFNNSVQAGLDWIQKQAQTAQTYGKPSVLTGFGLVTVDNVPFFVPFNSTTVATNTGSGTSPSTTSSSTPTSTSSSAPAPSSTGSSGSTGVTDDDRNDGYSQWLQQGISSGINGMLQYQWGSSNLTPSTGTTVTSDSTGESPNGPSSSGQSPTNAATGESPNDGYTINGSGDDNAQGVLQTASQGIASDSG